jgi:hypothetical protein
MRCAGAGRDADATHGNLCDKCWRETTGGNTQEIQLMPIFKCGCGCGTELKSGKFKYLRGHKPKTGAIATAKPIAREHGRFKMAIAELAKERERIDVIIDYLESLN